MANELIHASQGTSLTQAEFEAVGLHVCNSQATGDLIYASSATQLSRLAIGTTDYLLSIAGGVPVWVPRDIGAKVYHSVDQSIPNDTYTNLAFNTEDYDTDVIHDTVTNNSRLTCKTAGKYSVTGRVSWASDATGIRWCTLLKNGSQVSRGNWFSAVGASTTVLIFADIMSLAVNDYIEIQVYQNRGSALDVLGGSIDKTNFAMQRIG